MPQEVHLTSNQVQTPVWVDHDCVGVLVNLQDVTSPTKTSTTKLIRGSDGSIKHSRYTPTQFSDEVQPGKISESTCVDGPWLQGAFKIYLMVLYSAPPMEKLS